MESTTRLLRLGLALGVCLFLAATVRGQERARITFDKFEFNGVRSPEFNDTTHSQSKSEYEWFQIYAQYTAMGGKDGWLDEVELHWSVLIRTPDGLYMLLQTKTTYVDIEAEGTKHNAAVYIRPTFLRRYCDKDRISRSDVWLHVEASVEGRVVAKEDFGRSKPPRGDGNWWQAKDSRQLKLMDGALLSPDKTPFAAFDSDFYDWIKVTPGR